MPALQLVFVSLGTHLSFQDNTKEFLKLQYKNTKSAATKCKREVAVLCNAAVTTEAQFANNRLSFSLPS
jgi:alanine racemase